MASPFQFESPMFNRSSHHISPLFLLIHFCFFNLSPLVAHSLFPPVEAESQKLRNLRSTAAALKPATKLLMDPVINSVTPFSISVEQYEKLELSVDLTAQYENPYDYDQVRLSAIFTSPSGQKRTIDGFFMWDLSINPQNGNLSTNSEKGEFRIRFAPDEVGTWTYEVQLEDHFGSTAVAAESFQCTANTQPENKGFVRSNQTNFLNFDNGEQYIAIGENICWHNDNAYLDYRDWLTKLKEQGGNFFRLWHAHWGLGLEWRAGQNQYHGLRQYKEINSIYQDWLFDYCNEKGIYVMVAMQHHGQVSTQVNPNWNDSPYNIANGGPCQNTWDFFKNEEAIAHTKNRIRYIIARWGYARSIMAWELFNEVEWTDDFDQYKQKVVDWHSEMAQYIKSIDSYHHLITTSFAHDYNDPMMWALPDMDITQTHFYFNAPNLERVLARGVKQYIDEYGKPTLTGEFGLGNGGAELRDVDPNGIHFHNGLWSPLFSGGLGTGMSWWWDSYIAPNELYYHLGPIANLVAEIPFLEKNMQATESKVSGAPGDLTLTPALGWGGRGTAEISIDADGLTEPSSFNLGQYLYGSSWNTQYRSPPRFSIQMTEEGRFSVRTAGTAGTAPRLAIYLDGNKVLEETGQINTYYTIDVPAGSHTIEVDNIGTDWITISAYIFGKLGSVLDAYTLRSEDQEMAAGWIVNNKYNHEYVDAEGIPPIVQGASLSLAGIADGRYFVSWYDCLNGQILGSERVSAHKDTLTLSLPDILWDIAFVVGREPVGTTEQDRHLAFQLYPNPAKAGSELKVTLAEETSAKTRFQLLEMGGRGVATFPQQQGLKEVGVQLPAGLPSGLYWLRIADEGKIGARPIMIGE